jgi:hypothetical protein
MPVLDVRTWSRGDIPGLGLTDEDVGFLRGVDCDILAQGLIGLIEYSYHHFFSGSPPAKNSGVKCAWPGAILGWVTGKFSRVCTSEDKSAQKSLGLVCEASL